MHRLRKRITYANTMSTIAVFLVLGGASAYAASHLGRNSVGAKQLKRNAVTAAKIKRNAITGAKIKNGAVTGAKIKAGTIGPGQLGDGSVGNAETQFVKVFKGGPAVAVAASEKEAPKVPLGSVGPFRFYGKCFKAEKGVVERIYIEIVSGSATLANGFQKLEANLYLTPGLEEEKRAIEEVSAQVDSFNADSGVPFAAAATDGTEITGQAGGGAAKEGSPTTGNGPFLAGNSCVIATVAVFGG